MTTQNSLKAYDLSFVEKIAKGNQAFIKKMVSIFIRTAPTDAGELLKLCADKQYLDAAELAHRLKGSVSTLQMGTIEGELKEIEISCRDNEIDDTLMRKAQLVKYVINVTAKQLEELYMA